MKTGKHKTSDFTGIVLAGGKASRLGQDKGLLINNGIPLLKRAVGILAGFCDQILVSTNNAEYLSFGYTCIHDQEPGRGPLMGLYSSLKASKTKHNLVMAVDNIFVGSEFFTYVTAKLDQYPAALPYLQGGYFEPLCGYYSKEILHPMEVYLASGKNKPAELLKSLPVFKLDVKKDFPFYSENYFKSINLPEDLLFLT